MRSQRNESPASSELWPRTIHYLSTTPQRSRFPLSSDGIASDIRRLGWAWHRIADDKMERTGVPRSHMKRTFHLAFFAAIKATADLPEPDVVFYGHVTRSPPNTACVPAGVTWSLSGNAGTLAVSQTTAVSVNGETFYLTRIPFETRQLADHTPLPAAHVPRPNSSFPRPLFTNRFERLFSDVL